MKIVVTSGYFNPIHPGHIELFRKAKNKGNQLWVIVKNDRQAKLKRGISSFQNQKYREDLVSAIKYVDKVLSSIDTDLSVNKTLQKAITSNRNYKFILAKGGDAKDKDVLEESFCKLNKIQIIKNLGKKKYSSSDYI